MAAVMGHGPTPGDLRGAIDGGNIWWVSPSYKQIESSDIWRHLKMSCRDAATRISELDRRIDLWNGGSITVRSADSEASLRGPGLDGVIIDEASRVTCDVWPQAIRPALADKGGWAMMITTPNGKNWLHKQFVDARDKPDWQRWQCPSSDNPLITDDELESIKREIGPRAFAQEHGANFTDIEGALFPSEYFEDHIWADRWPDRFELSVLAIDPSIGRESRSGDYSAIVFAGLSGGTIWVESSLERRPPLYIVAEAYQMAQRLNPTRVLVESNGFQSVLGELFDLWFQKHNLPPLPLATINHHEQKNVRIQRLDPYLANRQLRFTHSQGCELLVEQLQMFPDKAYHDDGPDALEMSIWGMRQIQAAAYEARTDFERAII